MQNIDIFVQITYNVIIYGIEVFAMSKITTTNISIRMDRSLKEEAEKLFSQLGMNLSTAFNIFVRQSLRERRIPFVISCDIPNLVTRNAINEAENYKVNEW